MVVDVHCFSRWMAVRFDQPYRCTSWAVAGGGAVDAGCVAWRFLELNEIEHTHDIRAWFDGELKAAGLEGAVGLLTSRRVHKFVESGERGGPCHVLATVGLSNALSAGDPVLPLAPRTGTINILCTLSGALTAEASLEALALAAEARAAAMLDARVPSVVSGQPATGTGTDCIVVAHPRGTNPEAAVEYCGKHTEWGRLIGWHVRDAVSRGVAEWLEEMGR
jgi:adenosylcobinamide amidohydrolase